MGHDAAERSAERCRAAPSRIIKSITNYIGVCKISYNKFSGLVNH